MQTSYKKRKRTKFYGFYLFFILMCILTFICIAPETVNAVSIDEGSADVNNTDTDYNGVNATFGDLDVTLTAKDGSSTLSATLQIMLLLTVISLAPSILIMMTSFTRIVIVLHFTRSAIGTQSTPPNQILIGLSLFLTLFIMYPTLTEINTTAIQPLSRGEISQEEALETGMQPLRQFMIKQLNLTDNESDLNIFVKIAGIEVETIDDVPITVLIPAFILNELRIAFIIGFLIYLPFIVIDMVVASTLMSMGMMMLPPTTISMPFKILLFVMADGWSLIIGQLVETFIS